MREYILHGWPINSGDNEMTVRDGVVRCLTVFLSALTDAGRLGRRGMQRQEGVTRSIHKSVQAIAIRRKWRQLEPSLARSMCCR